MKGEITAAYIIWASLSKGLIEWNERLVENSAAGTWVSLTIGTAGGLVRLDKPEGTQRHTIEIWDQPSVYSTRKKTKTNKQKHTSISMPYLSTIFILN